MLPRTELKKKPDRKVGLDRNVTSECYDHLEVYPPPRETGSAFDPNRSLDRNAQANACVLGIEKDLHLREDQFNPACPVLIVGYIAPQISFNIILVRLDRKYISRFIWLGIMCLV